MKNEEVSLKERIDKAAEHLFFFNNGSGVKILPALDVIYGLFIHFDDLRKDEKPEDNKYGLLYTFLDGKGFYNLKNINNVNKIHDLLIKEKLVLKTDWFITVVCNKVSKKFSHEEIFKKMEEKFENTKSFERFFSQMDDLSLVSYINIDRVLKENVNKVTEKVIDILLSDGYDFFSKRQDGFLPYESISKEFKEIVRDELPTKYVVYEKENIEKILKPEESIKNKIKKRL